MRSIIKLPRELREISFRPNYPFGVEHEDYLYKMKKSIGANPYKDYIVGEYNFVGGNIAYVTAEVRDSIIIEIPYVIPLSGIFREDLDLKLEEEIHKLYGRNGEKIDNLLEKAGYRKNSELYVPHSENADEWGEKLVKRARVLSIIEQRMNSKESDHTLETEPKIEIPDNLVNYFRPAWDWPPINIVKSSAGKYTSTGMYNVASDTNTIAAYDRSGIPYIGLKKEGVEKKLEQAGFKKKEALYTPQAFVQRTKDLYDWLNYMFLIEETKRIKSTEENIPGNIIANNNRILEKLWKRGIEIADLLK